MPPVLAAIGTIAAVGSAVAPLVGGAILGISAGTLGLIALGATLGASLLRGKPKAPANSSENVNRLRANIDVRTPRKTVVGRTAMATDIRDEEFTDSQGYFHRFIVCASHKVSSIESIYFDDKLAWTSAGGVQGEFVGWLTVATRLEGSAANAINISSRMGSTRRYTGLAYIHFRYKINDENSPFAQSITTRITIIGNAAMLYDPRMDSTVAGGSGAQRADDQTTWVWDDDACRNPALALLFYLLGWRINGELAIGKGIPLARIDLASFAVAANICDEIVPTISGTEPRYRCDGMWSEGDAPSTVIDMLKATMNADLDDVDGKLRVTIFHNDLALPEAHFTEDDVTGAFDYSPAISLDQTYNITRGTFTDASPESLYQQVDYPQIAMANEDGVDRIETFDLPTVQSVTQAQRLAYMRKKRNDFGATFSADFQATAWAVQKNSVVRLTFGPAGLASKLFRVAEMEIRTDGTVPLVLREEHADLYGSPVLQEGVTAIATTPYNPALNPVIGSLNAATTAAEQTYIINSWQSLDIAITGTATTITISNHSRIYGDKTVAVTGATLTGRTNATTYYLYYDDAGRNGGAVTWGTSTSYATASNSSTTPARHYAGTITTGAGAIGYGVLPPGSYYYP